MRAEMRKLAAVAAVAVVAALGLLAAAGGGERPPAPAPELENKIWLNTPGEKPLRLGELRGKVVLVQFWTFACYNCKNTLPYLKEWHKKYAEKGLVMIGVHTPELPQERNVGNVRREVKKLGIEYAVAIDNDYATWNRYGTEYWPTLDLIDHRGNVVWVVIGEGEYAETEAKIQQLLEAAAKANASATETQRHGEKKKTNP